jgi:hypothetical protein
VLIILFVLAILLGLTGLACDEIVEALGGGPRSQPVPTGTPSASPTGTASAPGCVDDLAGFRAYAGPQTGARGAALASVTVVCWEPGGVLRVESGLSPDVSVSSESIAWLCQTLSGHISQSGRPWQGFTVYSKHPAFDGQPMLAGRTPDGTCTKPQR